eukprot:COSAG04_NODE_2564_length_3926_cov_337.187876_5_plen_140_part_00
MRVLKWDLGARRFARIETRFRPERCRCWCAAAGLRVLRSVARHSAGVVATVVNGLCPFSEPGASSDPGWCGVSGAFALAVRWDRFAVQGWHCGSGANVALVPIGKSNPGRANAPQPAANALAKPSQLLEPRGTPRRSCG